jgi:nickel superoxide dismutase
MNFLTRRIKPVYAHCDVPCGIYETDTMRHAADTCLRMTEKIAVLPENFAFKASDDHNNFVRMVNNKEEHAKLCKQQITTLWSDYFKPEYLEKYPNLHDIMWQAAKQCSRVKWSVNKEECKKLIDMVIEIDRIFTEIKVAQK